ncbi:hypothetical protein BSKO_06511 [Bryopsis sp. KO-2023]|nr:hypothetical protein BSKO_06511 [Bryopsis sp. KO-2023]
MITYNKSYWGLPLLLRVYGSAFPRTWPFAVLSGFMTLVLEWTVAQDETEDGTMNRRSQAREWWGHPYPYQTFAFIVGFILVFRSNFGYGRYWEGRTNLQLMSAKWADAVIQVLNFDFGTLPLDIDEAGKIRARKFADTYVHLISLMHGVAVQNLRRDWDLDNLTSHDENSPAPPLDPKFLTSGGEESRFSWKDITQLRSDKKHKEKYNSLMKIHVLGGLTPDEKEGLGDTKEEDDVGGVSRGCRLSSGLVIPGPAERVQVVMAWIHQIILERRREGGLAIEPPIMTRVYQVLSEGMLGFEQCRKIMDTPFPFPWVQFVTVCLLLYTFTVPIVIASYITADWLAFILTVFAVMTYHALNEVARDLEDPFIYDPNDLPMARHQWAFNERIVALSSTKRPITPTDRKKFARLRTLVRKQSVGGVEVNMDRRRPASERVGGNHPDVQLFEDDERVDEAELVNKVLGI